MEIKYIKNLIKEYRNNKDSNIFHELTVALNLQKCILTGNDIIYPNTIIRLSKDNTIKLSGTSAYTKKIVNGKEYNLKISYDGMADKFGEEYTSLNISRVFNQLNKFTKFAFQIPDKDYEIAKKIAFGSGVSLDGMIQRYGKEKGTIKFNEYKKKQAHSNSFEYKHEKYGWDIKKYENFNKSRGITLQNQIKKYGKNEGILRFEKYCEKQSKTSTIEYLINRFGEERANEILDAKGKRIEYFERIYGENAIEKYVEYWNSVKNPYYSKVSIELFDLLIFELNLNQYKIYYKENEYGIYDKDSSQYFKYDFTIPELNLIIEFNGDAWHANPSIYSKDDKPHPINKKVTASELWKYDNIKKSAAESNGFNVLYVWENDYRNNFENMYIILKENINELRTRRN
jgi:very-short-patch-repair endonuclease